MTKTHPLKAPSDAVAGSWVNHAPLIIQPYLRLARYDRPAGFWLLGIPCIIGLALARAKSGFQPADAWFALLYVAGAITMRGAGCTYNDILDRDIDAKVARTAARPLPSGAVSVRNAWLWLIIQCSAGLAVLVCLPPFAKLVALGSIPMVALYPMMKRITWWPQVWLGLTFNWGVLVATATATGEMPLSGILLYGALVLWTVGYDTIYAVQDREDDALIGVKSTARLFGSALRPGVAVAYALAILLAGLAGYVGLASSDTEPAFGAAATIPFALHLVQQCIRLDPANPALALALFRANRDAGILLLAGWALVAAT